jgi:hypothetical protein
MKQQGSATATVTDKNEYQIHGDGKLTIDPIILDRLRGMSIVIGSLELDPELWNPSNPIWRNSNNHVMLMFRQYYMSHETDETLKSIFGPIIDHFVWMYVAIPELRARIGWMLWFLIVYVTDNQFKKETGVGFQPEPWNDPRQWALANEIKNPITTTLTKVDDNK